MTMESDMNKLNISCDCAKCGISMQNESILSNDEYRARVQFKCYQCGNEVVVNRWWNLSVKENNVYTTKKYLYL